MMAVCAGSYHLSKRMIEELLSDFFDVNISLGSISNLEQQTREAIAGNVAVFLIRRSRCTSVA